MQRFYLAMAVASAALLVVSLAMALSDPAAHSGLFFTAGGAAISLGLFLSYLRRSRREGRRPS